MKPQIRKNKDGEIIGYRLYCFVGRDSLGNTKFETKLWKPDKKYTARQLEKEIQRQQMLFEEEVKEQVSNNAVTGKITIKTKFKAYADYWIINFCEQNNKKKTISSYKVMLTRIKNFLGDYSIDKIDSSLINSFFIYLKKQKKNNGQLLSPKTIKNHYILLCSMFSTLVDINVIKNDKNPMNGMKCPKTTKTPVDALSQQEAVELIDALEKYAPLKYHLFIKIALITGLRRGEICGLKWSEIKFNKKQINVVRTILYDNEYGIFEDTPKTASSTRCVTVSDDIINLLKSHKKEQDKIKKELGDAWQGNDYVFTQQFGQVMHPNTPYTWFARFQKKYNLPKCSIHKLRHTTATLLILNGVNIKSVSSRLGHSNSSTTLDTYAFYLQSADETNTQLLSNILEKNKKS